MGRGVQSFFLVEGLESSEVDGRISRNEILICSVPF